MKMDCIVLKMIIQDYFYYWWDLNLRVLLVRRKHVILIFIKSNSDINEAAVLYVVASQWLY